ncbi:hypothetical protein BT93_K2225 [Corymbia citriodora subsp. variegata]|nr:hypothetical protein BT93_K2225 [Corymbia citriodora subsp. variegata]
MEGDNRNEAYRECLRNHAASLGSYATDGCGEFTSDDTSPGSLQCVACGCHRNFHRKVTYATAHAGGGGLMVCRSGGRDNAELGGGELVEYGRGRQLNMAADSPESGGGGGGGGKKRFRTKFTVEQKEKMMEFAEKLGWKMQRKDEEDEIERFCRSVGVSRQVFKVWMHNHKNSSSSSTSASTGNASSLTTQ